MNYAEHNKELGETLYKSKKPVVFIKPDSSLLKDGKPLFLPDELGKIDYETELVVRICRVGKSIPLRFAYRYYDAVTVGIDFTARDMQKQLREEGLPWTLCKGFDGAATIGTWVELTDEMKKEDMHFHLDINGATIQEGCSGNMTYSIDELIAYISQFMTLKMGDLLFTGTPAGVGPVNIHDRLTGWLEDRKVLEMKIK